MNDRSNIMSHIYWNHFLALEDDLAHVQRYIEFDEENFKTYSIEFVKLLLAIGSEIDVICKLLCHEINQNEESKNICSHRKTIIRKFPAIFKFTVRVENKPFVFIPWESGGIDKTPEWWDKYNDVKHHRSSCYHEANLKNTFYAISGLLTILLYYYSKLSTSPFDYGGIPTILDFDGKPANVMFGGNIPFPK